MKDNSRSVNIHHTERLRAIRKDYSNVYDASSLLAVGRITCTPANCSCYMCGNPRKFFNEITMQEKKHKDIEKSFGWFPDYNAKTREEDYFYDY